MDARGAKGAWESLVYYVHPEKTAVVQRIAAAAQWFEDRMPWDPKYRKQGVQGITANAIDVVIETGESGPITPVVRAAAGYELELLVEGRDRSGLDLSVLEIGLGRGIYVRCQDRHLRRPLRWI